MSPLVPLEGLYLLWQGKVSVWLAEKYLILDILQLIKVVFIAF